MVNWIPELVSVIMVFKIISVAFLFNYYFQIIAGLGLPIHVQDPPFRVLYLYRGFSLKRPLGIERFDWCSRFNYLIAALWFDCLICD